MDRWLLKKSFVWFEQGIGDEIMFSSLIQDIAQSFDNVFFGVNEKLISIFRILFLKI